MIPISYFLYHSVLLKKTDRIQPSFRSSGSWGQAQLSQPCQPLPRIRNLNYPRICIFPEVEEFFVMLYGFSHVALLLKYLTEHIKSLCIDIAMIESAQCELFRKVNGLTGSY